MTNALIETIVSESRSVRNRSISLLLRNRRRAELLRYGDELDAFRRNSGNLYHKVRASLFLFVIYRFYLQEHKDTPREGEIPLQGIQAVCDRNFEKSINIYRSEMTRPGGLNGALFSAVADAYYKLSFQYLLDQVKLSISHCRENAHLYQIDGLSDYPFSVSRELMIPDRQGRYPVGVDLSPVRLDPSHSGWSDIFFLGMDFPEGAKVINISVNLGIHGSGDPLVPPCECYCRYIEEPVLHLVSVDLKASKKVTTLEELFNFGNDYLSLLKAGIVASGIVPPSFEKKNIPLKDILTKLLNKPGGIEVVTRVNNIPKGSRLAVSTSLLATIITRLMRFSSQIKNQTGPLEEAERRVVASRAILGEWLGGSGGGWQDSGGLWPGIKIITGRKAETGDPEYQVSRGCLLPDHRLLSGSISTKVEEHIMNSMVLVHGGISQDVGSILEMVTEKYLLRYSREWEARLRGIGLFNRIVHALSSGDMKKLGELTTEDWEKAIQEVIPWVNNAFTDDLIGRVQKEFREDYWGFLMLGGMSGGGMAFIVNPHIRDSFKNRVYEIMQELKEVYQFSLPFIVSPLVYDFEFNRDGIVSRILAGDDPSLKQLRLRRDEKQRTEPNISDTQVESEIMEQYGFDRDSHEHMRTLLKKGEIGLRKNHLLQDTSVENVSDAEILRFEDNGADRSLFQAGMESLKKSEVAVVTFSGGLGSRWSSGAAVVKPISPFIRMRGKYRTFLEVHLAKSRKTGALSAARTPHVFTTSYLTHRAIEDYLKRFRYFDYGGDVFLSPAKSIGRRVYPMERDLRFYWNEQIRQKEEEHVQKVQDDVHAALIEWVKKRGQGEDYSENRPILRFNPPGHWYEIPNLIKNGLLSRLLQSFPSLKYLLCHNIDTLGAHIDPSLLGLHIANKSCITFEVIPRRIDDKGGGLAKINGRVQLVEGLALPREEDEYKLTYYSSLTNWITIDSLLDFFGLDRDVVIDADKRDRSRERVAEAIRRVERVIPTYVTIKSVKYLRGGGQEDIYPVAQFEKLWGDMSGLRDLAVQYVAVSRYRGQQLKEPSQLYRWVQDGSLEYLKSRVIF